MKSYKKDLLDIKVFDTRAEKGSCAADHAETCIKEMLQVKDELNVVFAAAPSQNDFLKCLSEKKLEWNRINAFHMDEYIGLSEDAPQGFGNFLKERIFSLVPFKSVYYLYDAEKTPEQICEYYGKMLSEREIDIVFMGIGENGHIAFNDPHVAYFDDPEIVKIVDLDAKCRQQQVNDGCFETLDLVPKYAITLTIPTMMKAGRLIIIAPTALKADAISKLYNGPISQSCPASITRRHPAATLFTDVPGASKLEI